jgi:hypothetical protein
MTTYNNKIITLLSMMNQSYYDKPLESINYQDSQTQKSYQLIDHYYNNYNRYCIYCDGQSPNITELIISIAGTDQVFDVFMDLYILPYKIYDSKNSADLYSTSGLQNMYNLLKKKIKLDIFNILNKNSSIINISIIGHSLGGSISTMLLLDLLHDNKFVQIIKKKIPENNSNINLINLITYNSPKFFATFDDDRKFDQPNTYINEFIYSLKLENNINIINMINNHQASNIISYDFDHDILSLFPLSNKQFKHICDKNNNIYLLNKKDKCIEKIPIYNIETDKNLNQDIKPDNFLNNKLNPKSDNSTSNGIFYTIYSYLYYICLAPFNYNEIRKNHSILTTVEYLEEKSNFDFSQLPENL